MRARWQIIRAMANSAGIGLVVFVLYVLSYGPVHRIGSWQVTINVGKGGSHVVSPRNSMATLPGLIDTAYSPLSAVAHKVDLDEELYNYLLWWEPEIVSIFENLGGMKGCVACGDF